MPAGYDALRDPDPSGWLAMDEALRIAQVLAYHERLKAPAANHRLHASLHVVAETQIASGEPPEAREALARLLAEGLDRHEAIHAIADVASTVLLEVAQNRRPYDAKAHGRALRALTAAGWKSRR